MASNNCATCAQAFGQPQNAAAEKTPIPGRYLECCGRTICSRCLNQNKRYEAYCPYCQVSSTPTSLPQGLKDPPAYPSLDHLSNGRPDIDDRPPSYVVEGRVDEKHEIESAPDVLHFVAPNDSINSLSLAYGVPSNVLRKTNNIFADHLLHGRKTLLIPGEYYKGGVSLSPRPLESEEEELRKSKIRRWMMQCKVSEYDIALLYLKQAEWSLEDAIEAFRDDERWEKDNPRLGKVDKGKSAKTSGMRRFVGQTT